ncbi:MAG: hypothetical protein JSS81_10875 [Acidobacteria bacterium]|nr:hypothetical protein [Acidobacteriota bacterium]
MKVCPKCNSSYSDETLNFCLTDGVPLVVEELLDEYLSKQSKSSWHTAETLVDPRFSRSAESKRTAAPGPSARTNMMSELTADSLQLKKSNNIVFVLLGILVLAVAVGGFWWYSKAGASRSAVSDNTPAVPKHAIVPLTPEQEAQLKKELTDFIQNWARTNEDKDADAHIAHYANTLEIYYGESGKDKNHVLADRLRAWQKYDTVQMTIDNLKIKPESTESATLVFDKSWTMKNSKRTSNGSVQQEMHVSRTNGKWLIDTEKDLNIYFMNNRDNQLLESDNQPAPESKPAPPVPSSSANTANVDNSNKKK